MSRKNKLFKEVFKMSSAAAQQAGTKAPSHKLSCFNLRRRHATVDPTQPNPPKTEKFRPNSTLGSTPPMDNSGLTY